MTLKRSNADLRAGGIMTVLCIIWGVQQVAIKGVAMDISPVLQVAIRSGFAALLVWIVMACRGEPLRQSRPYLTPGCMVGVLFALEFLFVAEGLRFTSASHMAVFLYTAPAFAAIGLQLFHPDERLVPAQWAGIFIAFTGIAVAFLSGSSGTGDVVRILTGDAMGLMAGLAWGATTVVVRCTALSQAPATHTLFYQLSGACALLSVYALFSGQHHFRPGITAGLSLIFQIFIVGFASYLTWFSLMKTYLASQLGVLSFMTPVFGVIAGMLLLGEEPQPGFFWGTLLILSGIVIVSGWPWFITKLGRAAAPHRSSTGRNP
ncbi:DMT family transporter [Serratia marcescens]|uniref:DMT family transporter n=1 Tax=Serratia marcescens TaxID=615 RepID=UPI001E53C35D|nr:DMT family transporter [Serratia marcescens]